MFKFTLLFLVFLLSLSNAKTITDPLNRIIEIPNNPQTIIAIGPASLRLLTYMQLQDKLIGVEQYEKKTANDKPYSIAISKEKINSLEVVALGGKPGMLPNLEKILEIKPDIIFVSIYSGLKNIELITKKTGIPTVGLIYGGGKNFKNISYLEGSKQSFKILGEIFSKEKRANELIEGIERIKNELNDLNTKDFNKTVYVGGLRHKGQRGLIATDFEYLPFELLNIENVFKGKKKVGSVFVQKEAILEKNPDYIFMDIGGEPKILNDLKTDENFYKQLKAFKNKNNTWVLHSNFYSLSLSNALINSYIIANKLGFKKFNIDEKTQEIFELFFKEDSNKVIKNYYEIHKDRI